MDGIAAAALPAGAGMLAAAVLVLIAALRIARARAPLTLDPDLSGAETPDQAAAVWLDPITRWVEGRAYYAYWLNEDGTVLQLRAHVSLPVNPTVAPDYSGLVVEESPTVPLTLSPRDLPAGPTVWGSGPERWLDIPFGTHCLVRVLLPPRRRVSRRLLRRLREAGQTYAPLAAVTWRWCREREEADRVRSLEDSTRMALDTTLRADRAIELLLRVGAHMVGSRAACAVVAGLSGPMVVADSPDGQELADRLLGGELPALAALPAEPDVVPGCELGPLGLRHNACVRVPIALAGEPQGCFFYLHEEAVTLNTYQRTALRALAERAGGLAAGQRQLQAAGAAYMETLRSLVAAMDGLAPYSLGHSDRLARYARMTALALGLSEPEAEAVALAAYFHDVGMVAVDTRILLKPGRWDESEYETVKVHPELGARLVAPLEAALPLAPMVAAHHERWDGHGYPEGLKGEEIPLGARIISVADLFDAKTTGRSYRPALPFSQAVAHLRAAAGNQLDPQVVDAFLTALEQERRRARPGLPMARCWELKQLPEHVCAGCPNRVPQVKACWEEPGRLCTRHGDTCETCVVYTETLSRSIGPAHAGTGG